MAALSRGELTREVCRIRHERKLSRTQMSELFGICQSQLPTYPIPSKKRQISWDRLVMMLTRLGYEVRYELVRIDQ